MARRTPVELSFDALPPPVSQLTITTAASKRFDEYHARRATHSRPPQSSVQMQWMISEFSPLHRSEPLTKPPAIPLHSVAANRTSLTAIYVDRRGTGLIRHVDFQDVPSPNLAKVASFGNENAMKAAVRRTKCISVETLYLVEVDCDKFHAFLSFQVS